MHISSSLKTMALALSMTLATGALTAAFAADSGAVQQQQAQVPQVQTQRHAVTNASPYDSPDFVIQDNNIHS